MALLKSATFKHGWMESICYW